MQHINWAVLGCGHIASTFMSSMASVDSASVVACAAGSKERAQAFASTHSIPHHFGSYQEMLQQRSINAVYIATTHNFHFEQIKLCLHHGKHVLCEKPLTLNASQAKEAFALAKRNNLLLIEAVWTRFLPAVASIKQALAKKEIGKILGVQANFSLNRDLPDTHRLNNKALAGGALLDLGIYPITLADIVFNKAPCNINSLAQMTRTGVDKNSFYTLEYECGGIAQLSSGFNMSGPTFANIMGSKGHIHIPNFLGAQGYQITLEGESPQWRDFVFSSSNNFTFEIQHMTNSLLHHVTKSDVMPSTHTLRVMQIMDDIRAQWGLSYQGEQAQDIN